MKHLIVVKAAQTSSDGAFLLGETEKIEQVRRTLKEFFLHKGIRTIQIFSGTSAREKASAVCLASLLGKTGSITYSHDVSGETISNRFPHTIGRLINYSRRGYNTVILVCAGNLADRASAVFASEVLAIKGVDDDPLPPASARLLDCETGETKLLF